MDIGNLFKRAVDYDYFMAKRKKETGDYGFKNESDIPESVKGVPIQSIKMENDKYVPSYGVNRYNSEALQEREMTRQKEISANKELELDARQRADQAASEAKYGTGVGGFLRKMLDMQKTPYQPPAVAGQNTQQGNRKIGDEVSMNGKKYKIVSFDKDGTPMGEEIK